MASSQPATEQPNLAQESSTSSAVQAAAGQEEAPQQEPVPEPSAPGAEAEKEDAEEEEGECGFCIYMKAGGCQDAFTAWMDCVEASDRESGDMVERCAQATINLKKCMDAHADYYAPVLQAEQAVSERAEAVAAAVAEAEKDKGGELSSDATPSSDEDNKDGTASSSTATEEVK